MTEKKAKEILKELPPRKVLGHVLLKRVGRRAWERPNVAISAKLYNLYAIPDPFLPNQESRKWFIGLGPVSLKLGENRRQPAPHLMPKEPPKPKKQTGPKLPNVPKAQTRVSEPKKDPQKDLAVQQALEKQRNQGVQRTPSKPSTDLSAEFGASPSKHKLARLPVRPDLQKKQGNPPSQAETSKIPTPIQRSIPKPKTEPNRSSNGRIRMQRTKVKPTLKRRPLSEPEAPENAPKTQEKASEEVKRTARPKAPTSLGLDDLFGIPADTKPLRLRPNRKKKD